VSDFYADWCGPCREFAPDYERLSKEYSRPNQIAFIKINTDHNQDLAQAYEIDCWPTLIIFDGGVEVEKYRGASEDGIKYTVGNVARQAGINLTAPSRQSAAIVPSAAPPGPSCLHCRDFSAPDNHAAKFPRESIPSHDIGWLAHQLTSPFPSPTDKARAIFTWLHHNVAYNVQAFFSGNVKSSTPQGTFQTGLAVCEGYAGLFAALAVKAGLEAIVIGGHGKGFGHAPLQPGQPIPPEDVGGHAWNAVKIDHAEWKLLDACWGAGNVRGDQTYEKSFKPERFTQSNDDFGLDHYPADSTKQFRSDGRVVSWPEYMTGNENGCGAQFFSGYVAEEGLSKTSFRPYDSPIVLVHQGPTTRFSFHRICPHWDPVRNGKGPPFLFVLFIEAQEGQSENHIPFETNGSVWWCDVPTSLLGGKGQSVSLGVLTTFGGNDGRGLRIEEYRQKKGRAGWSSGFVCRWEVA
jgi:thiol-disulfide isomerase/thioredoxin